MNSNFGVVIDPGHGGLDSGAVGNGGYEKDYALMISKYMYDRFKELGIPVYLTRTSDETLNPSERVGRILSAFGDNMDVIVLSNHVNAGNGDGAEVIYALRNESLLANDILSNIEKVGQNVRKVYQRRLPSNPMLDYYYILRETGNTEPVIIEYGFIDNLDDYNFIKANYRELAEAVVKGVLEYKGIDIDNGEYTVKAGDTLYGIANKYGVSVSDLKKANGIDNNIISIGEVLKIPNDDMETELYQVKAGDTLYGIASKYGISVSELKKLNNLSMDKLAIGQLLNVPVDNKYTVSKGDTLYSIAKKFGVSVSELKKVNNLISNMISVGDKLIIPMDTTYVVKAGDTLYSIAKKFNMDVSKLKELNNLVDDVISIGKILMVK